MLYMFYNKCFVFCYLKCYNRTFVSDNLKFVNNTVNKFKITIKTLIFFLKIWFENNQLPTGLSKLDFESYFENN